MRYYCLIGDMMSGQVRRHGSTKACVSRIRLYDEEVTSRRRSGAPKDDWAAARRQSAALWIQTMHA
jgi:hypothetical protein